MKAFFITIILLSAVLFSLVSCEESKATYATWVDMSQAPANQLSWIPPFMLEEAAIVGNVHNITECHDLDSNDVWGKATCSQEAAEWIHALEQEQGTLASDAQKRLSKLGLNAASALPHLYGNWQLVLEGDTLYFYGR